MAIDTIIVTKVSVSEVMSKLWNITLKLICEESTVEVINKDFSVRYRTGDDIDLKRSQFLELMQGEIDKWNSEQVVFDHTKMNNLVTYLEANLTS